MSYLFIYFFDIIIIFWNKNSSRREKKSPVCFAATVVDGARDYMDTMRPVRRLFQYRVWKVFFLNFFFYKNLSFKRDLNAGPCTKPISELMCNAHPNANTACKLVRSFATRSNNMESVHLEKKKIRLISKLVISDARILYNTENNWNMRYNMTLNISNERYMP